MSSQSDLICTTGPNPVLLRKLNIPLTAAQAAAKEATAESKPTQWREIKRGSKTILVPCLNLGTIDLTGCVKLTQPVTTGRKTVEPIGAPVEQITFDEKLENLEYLKTTVF
jgi:hypothetical protein